MNTHRAVRQYLAKEENKTELASEKVELGIDDYQRYLKESFAIRKKIESAVSEFVSVKKQLIAIKNNASKLSVESSQIQKEAEAQATKDVKAAKELGINDAVIMKPYKQVVKDTDDNIKIVERIVKQLGGIR
tara:strand:- start:2112 stop:2507 length:396 start_codon:yes stop_codon:yes gene_type:complete